MRFINAAIFLAAAGSAVAIPFGNTGYPSPAPVSLVDVPDNEILSENFSENDVDIEVIKNEIETRHVEHLEEFAKQFSVPETETPTTRRRDDGKEVHVDHLGEFAKQISVPETEIPTTRRRDDGEVHDEDEDPEVPAPPTPENDKDEETETHGVERRGDVDVPEHDHDEVAQHDLEPHVEKVVRGVIVTVIELKVLILKDLAIICKSLSQHTSLTVVLTPPKSSSSTRPRLTATLSLPCSTPLRPTCRPSSS